MTIAVCLVEVEQRQPVDSRAANEHVFLAVIEDGITPAEEQAVHASLNAGFAGRERITGQPLLQEPDEGRIVRQLVGILAGVIERRPSNENIIAAAANEVVAPRRSDE